MNEQVSSRKNTVESGGALSVGGDRWGRDGVFIVVWPLSAVWTSVAVCMGSTNETQAEEEEKGKGKEVW